MPVPDSVRSNAEATASGLRGLFPDSYSEIQFLGLELWHWICLAAILALAFIAGFLVTYGIVFVARRIVRRTKVTWDDIVLDKSKGPFRLAIVVLFFYVGSLFLWLPEGPQHTLGMASKIAAVLAVTWLALRITDILSVVVRTQVQLTNPTAADALVPIGRRAIKLFILVTAMVSLLQNVGFNITGLVAGLGVGGLAIALAAQKTIENVFGGISVLADRPVRLGEACKIGEVQGTLVAIGFRSAKIQTLDRTIVTIPNVELSTSRIENLASRDRFRLLAVLPIDYATPHDRLEALLAQIRKLLETHPRVLPEQARVRIIALGSYSIDVEIFGYIDTRDQEDFMEVREEIFMKLLELVPRSGAALAFPTRTVYLEGTAGMANTKGSDEAR